MTCLNAGKLSDSVLTFISAYKKSRRNVLALSDESPPISNMTSNVNSKVLGVLDPHHVSSVMTSSRTFTGGYPVPGPQLLTVTSAMNKNCFVDDNTWRLIAGEIQPHTM